MGLYSYIIIAIISYFIGAIPFALIIVNLFNGKDLRVEGTGNIGAMNSFDVTQKKWIGITAWFLDMLKGLAAILISQYFNSGLHGAGIAAVLVVLGHNFNVFLGFKGGRGLSSAMGVLVLINPALIAAWGIIWLPVYLLKKNIHVSNFSATVIIPFLVWLVPLKVLYFTMPEQYRNRYIFFIYLSILSLEILLRHIKPLRELKV